jgi:hypothetical protein
MKGVSHLIEQRGNIMKEHDELPGIILDQDDNDLLIAKDNTTSPPILHESLLKMKQRLIDYNSRSFI